MGLITATAARHTAENFTEALGRNRAIAAAGFRRYATYRQATVAATVTNSMFGFLRSYVMIAVTVVGGAAAGYTEAQLLSFVWLGQGLLGVLLLWGWNDLADRIRSGDVVMDLLRPQHPVAYFLAADLGRAAYAFLTRFFAPMLVGALCFTLYVPERWLTYPLGAASIVLGVVISFGCRYLVNAASFWLMDSRGVNLVWLVCSGLLAGLYFPLRFLPEPLLLLLWVATPMPSMLQAPLDILVERDGLTGQLAIVGVQICWATALIGLCFLVQRRAERRLVVQGG